MKQRSNELERISVLKLGLAIHEELGWIFREQPIVDLGIDAIIEQAEKGNGKGKFLAIQIKAGKSHFHDTGDRLTYYCTKVHYNYWLGLNLPIILVAYIPDSGKMYWEEISENTFKKANKRWKIDIPKSQELNSSAEVSLIRLVVEKEAQGGNNTLNLYKGNTEPDSIYDLEHKLSSLEEATPCVENIGLEIEKFSTKFDDIKVKLNEYIEKRYSDKSPQVKSFHKEISKILNLFARKIEHQTELFSELFADGLSGYHLQTILLSKVEQYDDFETRLSTLAYLKTCFKNGISGLTSFRNALEPLPKKKYPVLNEARRISIRAMDILLEELEVSIKMAEDLESIIILLLSQKK